MNDRTITNRADGNGSASSGPGGAEKLAACESIQGVLFDYLSRELGSARSEWVREHLRKCPDCKKAAADMQSAVDLLRKASREERGMATALSDDRRKRLRRALLHPVLDWMDRHHILASVCAALAALAVLLLLLRHVREAGDRPPEAGPTIFYGGTLAPGEEPVTNRLRPPAKEAATP